MVQAIAKYTVSFFTLAFLRSPGVQPIGEAGAAKARPPYLTRSASMFLDSVVLLLARATAGNGNYNRGYNALSFLAVAYRVAVSRNASTSALNLFSFRSPLKVDAEPGVQLGRRKSAEPVNSTLGVVLSADSTSLLFMR